MYASYNLELMLELSHPTLEFTGCPHATWPEIEVGVQTPLRLYTNSAGLVCLSFDQLCRQHPFNKNRAWAVQCNDLVRFVRPKPVLDRGMDGEGQQPTVLGQL